MKTLLQKLVDFLTMSNDTLLLNHNPHDDDNSSPTNNSKNKNPASEYRRNITITATPGLITFLDVALYRVNEGQLTRTVCAAHALLQMFLELKCLSSQLLYICIHQHPQDFAKWVAFYRAGASTTNNNSSSHRYITSHQQSISERLFSIESFARRCYVYSVEAIQRLSTDKSSMEANLPPFHGIIINNSNNNNNNQLDTNQQPHSSSSNQTLQNSNKSTLTSSSIDNNSNNNSLINNNPFNQNSNPWVEIYKRCSTEQQHYARKKDYWESPTLYCPDFVWADDSLKFCQHITRTLLKLGDVLCKSLITETNEQQQQLQQEQQQQQMDTSSISNNFGGGGGGTTTILTLLSPKCISLLESIISLLKHDIPLRLHQFKTAMTSDAAVSKRLYLVKHEYRAPFRAYLESYMNVQRAPSLSLVDDYLDIYNNGGNGGSDVVTDETGNNNNDNSTSSPSKNSLNSNTPSSSSSSSPSITNLLKQRRKDAEKQMQDYIQKVNLRNALELEFMSEAIEIEMSNMLLPFIEIAKSLYLKNCCVRVLVGGGGDALSSTLSSSKSDCIGNEMISLQDVPNFQELLKRLHLLLCTKAGNDTSTGIRPLLLDLQGIPRDPMNQEYEIYPFGNYYKPSKTTKGKNKNNVVNEDESLLLRINNFTSQILILQNAINSNALSELLLIDKKDSDSCSSNNSVGSRKGYNTLNFDSELFSRKYMEWYHICKKQRALSEDKEYTHEETNDGEEKDVKMTDSKLDESIKSKQSENDTSFEALSELIRKAEIEVSISKASKAALSIVRERLHHLEMDRRKRLEVLQEMVEEICLREMDIGITILPAEKDVVLELPEMEETEGVFGPVLEMAGF